MCLAQWLVQNKCLGKVSPRYCYFKLITLNPSWELGLIVSILYVSKPSLGGVTLVQFCSQFLWQVSADL